MKEYFARLNPAERRFLIIVAVALFLVINFFWIIPHFSDWNNLQQRLNVARATLREYDEADRDRPRLEVEVRKMEGEGEVPTEDQAGNLLGRIQAQVAQSGIASVSYNQAQFTRTNANDVFFLERHQPATITTGEKQLVDFLYNISSRDSLVRVNTLNVHPDTPRQQLVATVYLVASYKRNTPVRSRTSARTTSVTTATSKTK